VAQGSAHRLEIRNRRLRPIGSLPLPEPDDPESLVSVPFELGIVHFHLLSIHPELSYFHFDYTAGEHETFIGSRLPGERYKVAFNLSDGPSSLSYFERGPMQPAFPGETYLCSPPTAVAVLVPAGRLVRSANLLVGQNLMTEATEEVGLSHPYRPASSPSLNEPWMVKTCTTAPILQALAQIEGCPLRGTLKRLYVEAKALEALALLLAGSDQGSVQLARSRVNSRDVRKMHEARDILDGNLDSLPTLRELARRVGVSTTKLKQSYRAVFGVPVFEYARKERLLRAHSLLLEGALSVSEVAQYVGYHSLSHFSLAFKRQFDVLPSGLRHALGPDEKHGERAAT